MEWVFHCNVYSEQKKVQLAASTFIGDAAEWWDEERHCRRFFGERPIDTWYAMKDWLRIRLRPIRDEELRAGMDKIESLFSQWKESSLNLNKVCNNNAETPKKEEPLMLEHVETHKVEESLKTEDVEIPPVDETLMESMENNEDEGTKSEDHDVQRPSEVVFPFSDNDVTSNFHNSQPTILVFSKFTKLYHVSVRAKNKSERENMDRVITQWGKRRVFELMREKKRKKVRKGKRVREKWFVFEVLQVTMARI